jgi:phosphohistidine phosphatase
MRDVPILYLMRHGIAESHALGGRDEDRALTQEGIDKLRQSAAGLAWLEVQPDAMTSSPLLRARQTAEIIRDALAPGLELGRDPQLRPGAEVDAVAEGLRAITARAPMMVGHEPSISALAALLLSGSATGVRLPFKPGSIAAIELAPTPAAISGSLRWFATPEQLVRLGR